MSLFEISCRFSISSDGMLSSLLTDSLQLYLATWLTSLEHQFYLPAIRRVEG